MDNFREEVAVKHNRTGNMILYGLSWIAIVALGFIALLAFSAIMAMQFTIPNFIQLGVCGGLAYLIWRKKDDLRIEYDYTFTNGDLDVAKVFGNSRRKLMTSLTVKNVEACGAVTHQSFQRYMTMKDCKKHNWFVNRDAQLFYFYFSKDSVKRIIIIEVSDEMLALIKRYAAPGAYQVN